MEDGLVQARDLFLGSQITVLILVVMEDTLVRLKIMKDFKVTAGLNPYCSGQ